MSQKISELQEDDLRFRKLVKKISTKFINLSVDKIDQALNDQLAEIGKFFNAARVTVAKLSEKGEILEASHMWFSEKD